MAVKKPGTGESTETETDDAPKGLTMDDVNKAVTAQLSRFAEKALPDILGKHLTPIAERLEKTFASAAAPSDAPKSEPAPHNDVEKLVNDRVRAVEANFKKQLDEERRQRDEERKARLRDEEKSALSDALLAAGVSDSVLKTAAAGMLYDTEKRVLRGTDGGIKFKLNTGSYDEELDLAEGVKRWAASDVGKRFLPPKGAAGSGAAPSQGAPRQANGKQTKEERLREAQETLVKGLFSGNF